MPRAHTASQAADRELARLLQGYSIEVTTHSRSAVEACRTNLAPGTQVYIAFVPGETHHAVAATADRLRAAGFEPVPHVTARSVAGFTQLDDFLARLAGEAGVTRALVIAGDLEQHGIGRIGLACYRRRTAGSIRACSSRRCSPSSSWCAARAWTPGS